MRTLAVFTIVREDPFLPLWLDYYRRHVPACDLYVLWQRAKLAAPPWGCAADVLTAAFAPTVVPVEQPFIYRAGWLAEVTSAFQRLLLCNYRWVLFTHCDELLVPDGHEPLAAVVERAVQPAAAVYLPRLEVLQLREPLPAELAALLPEGELDWQQPWVQQRRYGATASLPRPRLTPYPAAWAPGWRSWLEPRAVAYTASDWLLVHLHRADYATALVRRQMSAAQPWHADDRDPAAVFRHNLLQNPEQLHRWLLSDPDDPSRYVAPVELPPHLRDSVWLGGAGSQGGTASDG